MTAFLSSFPPILQALFATLFTWLVTALGSAFVFVKKTLSRRLMVAMLGFAAGVMIAASFFSLLLPAIDMAEANGTPGWLPAVVGFLAGGLFLYGVDKLLPHLHPGLASSETEGIKTHWQRSILLVLAITMHNFPEGLAVGVAFGAVAAGIPSASLTSAVALAVGIGLQNFPEGMAVSMPLRAEGLSRRKAFMLGQASGLVEPIAGVLGALAVITMNAILPYALGFAAGAMIYVVVEELIPESQRGESTDIATLGALAGFAVMTFLDVALG